MVLDQVGRFHSVLTGACLPGFRLMVQPGRCGSAFARFVLRMTAPALRAIRVYYPGARKGIPEIPVHYMSANEEGSYT
jgi:hypothetical protein